MAQRSVGHTYLECVKNGSDKFYCLIELGNGKSLAGFGPRGAAGSWRVVDGPEARKLKTDKSKKYDVCPITDISTTAFNEASSHFQAAVGTPLKIVSGGLVTDSGAAPAPAPKGPIASPKPKGDRRSGLNPLNVWC